MSYPPYPEYQESGVEWLGEVPGHWRTPPFYAHFETQLGKMLDSSKIKGDQLYPYLRNTDVQWDGIRTEALPKMDFTAADRLKFQLRKGDLLVCEGGECGRCSIWGGNCEGIFYQKALHRVRALNQKTTDPSWLLWVLRIAVPFGIFQDVSNPATIGHLPADKLRGFRFALPPLPEQRQIATFLDRECARMNGLMAKQDRLIALLREKRQALISHTVTRGLPPEAAAKFGLDPHRKFKDSGIEWLGEVPEGWEVLAIGRMFRESIEVNRPDLPILTVSIHSGISDRELSEDDSDRKQKASDDRSIYKFVKKGDIAYNMMRAWQGAYGASAVDGIVSPAYTVARPFRAIDSKYFELLLRSPAGASESKRYSRGITDFRLRLYWDEFKGIKVPLPTLPEQRAIVAYLDEACGRIDTLIGKAERAIALLRERRTALISAAVTGKIDVRGEVTGLDEGPDPVVSRCGDSTGGSGGRNLGTETR